MKRNLLFFFMLLGLVSCSTSKDLATVRELDKTRYAGTWYEISRFPNRFEKGLECVSATYKLKRSGKFKVINKGYLEKNNNRSKVARGKAKVPNPDFPGRLKVRFFWPFSGDYYIIALDADYQYALVGSPSRKYLWILSRSRILDSNTYNELVGIARQNRFDVSKLRPVNQNCSWNLSAE